MRPGNAASQLIFKLTGIRASHCGFCQAWVDWMNDLGWVGCWRNRKVIVRHLVREATRRRNEIDKGRLMLKPVFWAIDKMQTTPFIVTVNVQKRYRVQAESSEDATTMPLTKENMFDFNTNTSVMEDYTAASPQPPPIAPGGSSMSKDS